MFKAAIPDPNACDCVAIWRPLVSDLEVVPVRGSHLGMIRKPFVQELAHAISKRLRLGPGATGCTASA